MECQVEQLKKHSIQFAFLFNSKITPEEFLELLAHDLGLQYAQNTKPSILIALTDYLVKQALTGQTVALIVDNAQKLSTDVLEEIELLGNLENRGGPLLQVVFAAQSGFEQQLEKPELRGLPASASFHGRDWIRSTPEETAAYVESRLAHAGLVRQNIFSGDILREIHTRSHGIPD